MTETEAALQRLLKAIATGDDGGAQEILHQFPNAALWSVGREVAGCETQENFLPEVRLNLYAGDTALHVVAAAYRPDLVNTLITLGADVRARNRRGAQPLHSAMVGAPGSSHWNPDAQAETIMALIAAGADPNAIDKGGVTPLHRAVRNRSAAAVQALIAAGADVTRKNGKGSTPIMLATQTTGRGGSGSPEAKAQQAEIIRMLEAKSA